MIVIYHSKMRAVIVPSERGLDSRVFDAKTEAEAVRIAREHLPVGSAVRILFADPQRHLSFYA